MENMNPYLMPGIKREPKQEPKRFQITLENIIELVCKETGIHWELISGPRGDTDVSNAKQIMCHFLFTYCGLNKVKVAAQMNQDHTTIIHSLKKYEHYYKTENKFKELCDRITLKINS